MKRGRSMSDRTFISQSRWRRFAKKGRVMALVGLLASWLPAHRAAAIDPVKAMRCE